MHARSVADGQQNPSVLIEDQELGRAPVICHSGRF